MHTSYAARNQSASHENYPSHWRLQILLASCEAQTVEGSGKAWVCGAMKLIVSLCPSPDGCCPKTIVFGAQAPLGISLHLADIPRCSR
jgi:hypothetical protein